MEEGCHQYFTFDSSAKGRLDSENCLLAAHKTQLLKNLPVVGKLYETVSQGVSRVG